MPQLTTHPTEIQQALERGWTEGMGDLAPPLGKTTLAVVGAGHEWAGRVPIRRPEDRYVYANVSPDLPHESRWEGYTLLHLPEGHEHETDEVEAWARGLGRTYARGPQP